MNTILPTHADEIITDYPMKMVSSPLVFVFKQALECQGDGELFCNSLVSGPLCETEGDLRKPALGEKTRTLNFPLLLTQFPNHH